VPIRTYTEDEARALGLLAAAQLEAGDVDGDAAAPARGADKVKVAFADVLERLRERTTR
jgi:flagellar protein FliO/FliZ